MWKKVITGIWRFLTRYINAYRLITGAGLIAAAALVLAIPVQMPDPDDWAYYHGVRNFSQGHLTVDNRQQFEQAVATGQEGGFLLQYLPIAYNKWALEKAPGYVLYQVPFQKLGIPRYANVLLALGMVIVTFILLKRLRDEKAAMIGSLLLLFTPIALVMLNRAYMDTYGSLAFLAMGVGLYFYYHLGRTNLGPVKGGSILFLAFFFTGWSVFTRYTNLPIAVIVFLHLVITRLVEWRRGQETKIKREIVPLILGIGLPVLVLALYDYYVFGSPLKYGYSYSPYPIKFAFQYFGQTINGESVPWKIILNNAQGYERNLLIGLPLLIIGMPGFFALLYFKCAAFFKRDRPPGKWSSLSQELTWGILLVLIGWFIFVFVLYLLYEWTAALKPSSGFVIFDRFLLPGLFPVAIVCALIMARFSLKILIPVLLVLMVYGGMVFSQWALDLKILPQTLTIKTLENRWPGYVFAPWVKYPPEDSGGTMFPWHILPEGAGPYLPRPGR
jgi:hypothetical protein